MFKFEKEQVVYDIAGVKLGGQPGEYPTVLIGSIFYEKHKIVSDPMKGEFDKKAAEELIKKQEELYDKTGNPFIIDVVGLSSEALEKYIDFVADVTEAPFLVDSFSPNVRLSAIKHAIEVGLKERAIYNSIDNHVSDEEINSLRDLGVESSVLMAYNPRNVWAKGRVEILRGWEGQLGLLEAAKKAGIKKTLIDTAVLDVPSIGIAASAIKLVKEEFGLPAGCAPSNAIATWDRVRKEYSSHAYPASCAGSALLDILMGADFVLYGPIKQADTVYPVCAMADAIICYNARMLGIRPKVKNHPLYKIF